MGRHRRIVVAAICALCAGVIIGVHFLPDVPFLSGSVASRNKTTRISLSGKGGKHRRAPIWFSLGSTKPRAPSSFLPEELAASRGLQLMAERPHPWSREVWALLLDRLFDSGARLVMFDLVFNFA